MKQPCVYMLASKRNGTLYVGVTSDLLKRVWEHKNDVVEGFTQKYAVHDLVVRDASRHADSDRQREEYQGVETCLEDRVDRTSQSGMD